ncbi:hypothetical protein HOD08_02675 [bacterium]|jgi:hypothetical protein|nr:hypothetical protein [bacterium]
MKKILLIGLCTVAFCFSHIGGAVTPTVPAASEKVTWTGLNAQGVQIADWILKIVRGQRVAVEDAKAKGAPIPLAKQKKQMREQVKTLPKEYRSMVRSVTMKTSKLVRKGTAVGDAEVQAITETVKNKLAPKPAKK